MSTVESTIGAEIQPCGDRIIVMREESQQTEHQHAADQLTATQDHADAQQDKQQQFEAATAAQEPGE